MGNSSSAITPKNPPCSSKAALYGCIYLPILFITCAFIYGIYLIITNGYTYLDESGWVPHEKQIDVEFNNSWVIGEYRLCYVYPNSSDEISVIKCNDLYKDSTLHTMTVSLDAPLHNGGSYLRSDAGMHADYSWRLKCQHKQESIDCKIPE